METEARRALRARQEEALGDALDPEDDAPETQATLDRLDREIRLLTGFLETAPFARLRAERPELRGDHPTDVILARSPDGRAMLRTQSG